VQEKLLTQRRKAAKRKSEEYSIKKCLFKKESAQAA
jgi:hypothetical protein